MILKYHTCFNIPMRKPMIYQYDRDKEQDRLVDIRDVCQKSNLYEFHNEDGSIVESLRNNIENTFSLYEFQWDIVINKIIDHRVLEDKDVAFIYYLFATQILRTPSVQSMGVDLTKTFLKDYEKNFTDVQISNLIKIESLPVSLQKDEQIILDFFLTVLAKKGIHVCRSNEILAINGDNPVVFYPDARYDFPDCALPITSHICLRLSEHKKKTRDIDMTPKETAAFNYRNICMSGGRFIYSSVPYNEIIIEHPCKNKAE